MGENATRGDIISIAAAGRVRSVDKDGIVTYGQNVEVEYGTARGVDDAETDAVETLGKDPPLDIGPAPSWRNLRVPLDQIPVEANSIRLVVSDYDSKPDQWVAVTPPRVPKTQKLNDVVGSQAPVMLDWAVGLAFPCQRPLRSSGRYRRGPRVSDPSRPFRRARDQCLAGPLRRWTVGVDRSAP